MFDENKIFAASTANFFNHNLRYEFLDRKKQWIQTYRDLVVKTISAFERVVSKTTFD